jgi:aldehyde:ferredoxin oxidoreductase
MAPNCINGKVLHVDLTNARAWVENPPESFYRVYGGGSAMGLHYLLKEMPRGVDPLAPENMLTLFAGVPTGLAISGQARLTATARSPLSGAIGDSQCGGFFPAMLKFAGFDGIVLRGRSPKPVYLWINEGVAELRDASHLWGKLTGDVDEQIKSELGNNKIEILQIGPAGEKQVRFAALMNMSTRANGRTGMGAVMGSKNLKAVAAFGTKKMRAFDQAALNQLFKDGTKNIEEIVDVKGLGRNGTSDVLPWQNSAGTLPTYNWNRGQFDQFMNLAGETMSDSILKKRETCFSCTVRCKRVVETEFEGQKVYPTYGGPEYETMGTLGSYCGIGDLNAVALGNQLCNQYGLDTISCGATIAFAMECFEKGLLTLADTGGVELSYGNAEAMVKMVELIGKREGFGKLLGEGSARVARQIGRNADEFLVTFKNQEAPAHMPQTKKSLGLIYTVNPFGADHQSSEHDPMYEEGASDLIAGRLKLIGLTELQPALSMNHEKVRFAYLSELTYSATDCYGLCQFVWGPGWQLYGPQEMADMLRFATGWDVTVEELQEVGERRLNMLRAFNAREGIDRKADVLPKKLARPLEGPGPTAGVVVDPQEMEGYKDQYYTLAGWDMATGTPTPAKLAALGLGWVQM